MARAYLIYGSFICLFFVYAHFRGWTVMDSVMAGSWSPHGAAARNYHK